MSPRAPIPNPDNECRCGSGRPCSLHEMTDDMLRAMFYLKRLNDTQRGRIMCWFCHVCGRELPPGTGSCVACEQEYAREERVMCIRERRAAQRKGGD